MRTVILKFDGQRSSRPRNIRPTRPVFLMPWPVSCEDATLRFQKGHGSKGDILGLLPTGWRCLI